MRGYSTADEGLDEYEEHGLDQYSLDQYEDADGEEYGAEEEEEEEEDPAPKKEVLQYLELRQKFKEAARKKIAKENGSGSNSRDRRKPQLENFGSFFGPSQPVIADRVIQESKSFLETQMAPRVSSHQKDGARKNDVPSGSAPKNGMSDRRPVDPMKTKVQKLKDTRDYSFLLSDDAGVPVPSKKSPGHSNSDTRSAQVPLKSKDSGQVGRNSLSHGREERRAVPSNSQSRPNHSQLTQKMNSGLRPDSRRPEKSIELKKQPSSSHVSGPGRPGVPKDLSAKKALPLKEKKAQPVHLEKKVEVTSIQRRGPDGGSIGKQCLSIGARGTMPNGRRPLLKSQNAGVRHPVVERSGMQEPSRGKILSKQSLSSSKPQMIRAPNQQISSRGRLEEDPYRSKPKPKPKPKPARRFADEEEDEDLRAINEIRKIFNYNPRQYLDNDNDLSDMEADFRTIQREEKRSARIAREEDERELKLIQEEEERERRRKLAKRKQ